jgi:hypothetical protein
MAVEARGLICLAMTGDRLDELDLPLMVSPSAFEDENEQTAFTVSIDAALSWGVTTGISADDRARTIQVAINPNARPADLRRPGHIFPLRAKKGGRTEASRPHRSRGRSGPTGGALPSRESSAKFKTRMARWRDCQNSSTTPKSLASS